VARKQGFRTSDPADCILVNSPDTLHSTHYLADPKIPLGLLYIASYLRSHGVTVRLLDCHTHAYEAGQLVQTIKDTKPYLVGLNITTPNRKAVYEAAGKIKLEAKPPLVIIGGPHASCLPSDVFAEVPYIDGLVMGEGEEVVLQLLQNRGAVASFPGFCAKADMHNGAAKRLAPRIGNLDSLPAPAYDLIDISKYTAVSPELYLASSRGCRYDCVFCCSRALLGKGVIFRSAGSVYSEILQLKEQYGINSFYFYDDNLLIWPELVQFCNRICPPSFQWTAQANINDLEADMIPRLASAGCSRLSFGFESGSTDIQEYIGKVVKPDALQKISKLYEAGISSRAFFIVGFPNETIRDILETAKLMIKLRIAGLADVAIFPARPFPGTRLFTDCLSISGQSEIGDLLEFQYLEDFRNEPEPWIRARLHRYNTIPSFQINRYFDSRQIRKITRNLYDIFHRYTYFAEMSDCEISLYVSSP